MSQAQMKVAKFALSVQAKDAIITILFGRVAKVIISKPGQPTRRLQASGEHYAKGVGKWKR